MTGMIPARREPRVGALIAAAATRPRNLAALAFMSLVGVMLVASGLFLTGIGVIAAGTTGYGLLSLRDVFDPELVREVHELEPRQLPPAREDLPIEIFAPPHAELIAAIRATAARIHARQPHRRELAERAEAMVRAAEQLGRAGRELHDYLADHAVDEIDDGAGALEELATTADSRARSAFEVAARARHEHGDALRRIQGRIDLVAARLAVIHESLQVIEARLVELAACNADSPGLADLDAGDLVERLAIEVAGFDEADDLVAADVSAEQPPFPPRSYGGTPLATPVARERDE